jgi:hypothetical protein
MEITSRAVNYKLDYHKMADDKYPAYCGEVEKFNVAQ